MPVEPPVRATALNMYRAVHEWATHRAFNSAGKQFTAQHPLLTCAVDLANRLTLRYKGATWCLEPMLYPEHHVRFRLESVGPSIHPRLHRSIPLRNDYTSVADFAEFLCTVMDLELKLQNNVIVHLLEATAAGIEVEEISCVS